MYLFCKKLNDKKIIKKNENIHFAIVKLKHAKGKYLL